MTRVIALAALVFAGVQAGVAARAGLAQAPTELKGDAILRHPIGTLALKTVELMKAGKIDDVWALRSKADQAEWKTASSTDRKDLTAMMMERAPSVAALTDAIRKTGVLTIQGSQANLEATSAAGDIVAIYELEGGQWRASAGPMILAARRDPVNETRVERGAILQHPIGDLALRYTELLHNGRGEEFMSLVSREGQERRKSRSVSERAEELAFLRKLIPARAALRAGIESGGVLLIEDDSVATLNVIVGEPSTTVNGVVTASSTTTALPFVKEDGQWKVKR